MDKTLKLLERGVQIHLSDKMYNLIRGEEDARGTLISMIGSALGQTLDKFEYPVHWRRFIERKDCPQYMKEIWVGRVDAYYPKLSLPDEPHTITFVKGSEKLIEES